MATVPINNMTAIWGSGTQTAILMDISDGGSTAGSKLIDLKVGGTSKFYVTKEGFVYGTNFTGSSVLQLQSSNNRSAMTYYDGSSLKTTPDLYYYPNIGGGGSNYFSLSSSLSTNYFLIDSKGSNNSGEAGIILSNNNNRRSRYPANIWGPDGWRIFSSVSGSITLSAISQSYQFNNPGYVTKTAKTVVNLSGLKQIRNNFYFWPDPPSYNSTTRDAAVGIGVSIPNIPTGSFDKYLRAKLHIDMFSSSVARINTGAWLNTPTAATVENKVVAILVRYGSGSLDSALSQNFYVSGSGSTYLRGCLVADGTDSLFKNDSTKGNGYGVRLNTNVYASSLTKGAGSFEIKHPNPNKESGYVLRHCFVESPTRGDNIYRYQIVTTTDNSFTVVDLPDYWKYLNENPQVWISPVDTFGIGYGSVDEVSNQIKINTNLKGMYNVLLIGTRKDTVAKQHFDDNGGLEYYNPKHPSYDKIDIV